MAKLKEILKQVLKENPKFFTTHQTGGDEEGRSAEWDVKYEPDI